MIESVNIPFVELIEFLTNALVLLLAVATGALIMQVLFFGCALLFCPQGRSRMPSVRSVGVLLLGLAMVVGVPGLQAQTKPSGSIPEIEARYTRVFGSDTIQIMMPQLSPDGRWIVYSSYEGGEKTNGIWLISVDGGDPIQLTSGTWDVGAVWFPTSDRIAFKSNQVDGVMTLSIDPATGRAAGPAQRITLESAMYPFVSPDGEWIAYQVWAGEGTELGMALRVIPARGGSARTLIRLPGRFFLRSWSLDSKYIYFAWRGPETPGPSAELMRVSIDGTVPEKVVGETTGESGPAHPYLIYKGNSADASGDPLHVISTLDLHPLARVSLPRNVGDLSHATRITPDGQRIVAVVSNVVAPLRVLPVAGGAARQLGDARTTEVPIGWTPDGQRVIFQTEVDGRVAMLAAPVDDGAAEEYAVIPQLHMGSYKRPVLLSEDGRYLAFNKRAPGSELPTFVIARVSDGELHEVSESLVNIRLFGCAGPGGLPTVGDEFLYLETHGDTVDLRAASFDRPSRLLRSFPRIAARRNVGVFENRVVWVENSGDSTAVLIAEGPDGQPRQLALVDAMFEDLVWSPDGRWIAGGAYVSGPDGKFKIMLIEITEDGELASPPRYLDTQIGVGWGIRWLPDSQALTVFAQTLPSWRTDVWLFSLREGEPPVALTRDETSSFWQYTLSSDGKYIAYPAEVPRGSSLWLVDLGDALATLSQ